MAQLVTIYGGSGFVGRYIARRLAKSGWRVRVAVRRPNEAGFVRTYGAVGQVEPVLCNIRDDASVAAAMNGADVVVNCVGILNEIGKNRFDPVQVEGAERVARIATDQNVARLVHLSAIGADVDAESKYSASKGEGEAAILAAFPTATILRPSVIFGDEDNFFNRFAALSRLGPVMKIVGGETKFQPVYVDDVAAAAVAAVEGRADAGVYELGGPDVKTLRALVGDMLAIVHRRRLVINLPFWGGSIIGFMLDMAQVMTGGLFANGILTRDQVKGLRHDHVVADGAKGLSDLGVTPTTMEAILPQYLYRFRPAGQYDAIKDSAKNLRAS